METFFSLLLWAVFIGMVTAMLHDVKAIMSWKQRALLHILAGPVWWIPAGTWASLCIFWRKLG